MHTWLVSVFFIRINPWKFGEKKIKIDKVIQLLLKATTPKEYKKYMVSTNIELVFAKLLWIDPYKKALTN